MSSIADLFEEFLISRYMIGAGITIMLYDWVLTLESERKYIWSAKWTAVKAIFLFNRYFMPFTLFFAAYAWGGQATSFLTPYRCQVYVALDSAIQLTFFATLHWLVAMRAWALWGRTKLMAVIIWGCFILYLTASSFITGKAMTTIELVPFPLVNVCFGKIPGFLWSIWLPSMVFETLVFLFTAIKAVHHSRLKVETPILSILYRDGFLYFVFICVNSFLNLLVWAVAPVGFVLLVKYVTTALCEVAGSHLVLDLIEVGHLTGATSRSLSSNHNNQNYPSHQPHQPHRSNRKSHMRTNDAYEMMPSPQTPLSGGGANGNYMSGGRDYYSQNQDIESTWRAPAEWSAHSIQESEATSFSNLIPAPELRQHQHQQRQISSVPAIKLSRPRLRESRSIQWSDQYGDDKDKNDGRGFAF